MGRNIRIGLMLAAASCLMAVMVDWVLEELTRESPEVAVVALQVSAEAPGVASEAPQANVEAPRASAEAPQASEAEPATVEVPQQGTGEARDATKASRRQG